MGFRRIGDIDSQFGTRTDMMRSTDGTRLPGETDA